MPRRTTRNITGIRGTGRVDYASVWRIVECSNPECERIFKVREDDRADDSEPVVCPQCDYPNPPELFERAARHKYCRVCETLQPLENFHRHARFRSGRQLECKVCKNTRINPTLNPLRTPDQHREASDRRRLYTVLSHDSKIDSDGVYKLFGGRCFNCGTELRKVIGAGGGYHLDHTLPVKYLWPLTTGATLLCAECNNAKHERWPSEFYEQAKLRKLAVLTGIEYPLLAGQPRFNLVAVRLIQDNIDEFLAQWVAQADEIGRLRNTILKVEGVDIYDGATNVPDYFYV